MYSTVMDKQFTTELAPLSRNCLSMTVEYLDLIYKRAIKRGSGRLMVGTSTVQLLLILRVD